MNYQETISYLFNVAPLFQNIGSGAYKEGLSNTQALDQHFQHPHRAYPTIHVAGTNGKGSVSHTLAAILQSAGLRVGLYTSPHLIDFRERIKVNGCPIPEERVVQFVEEERGFFEPLAPSFFELTTALAFLYFREQKVDVAVIEVGLGGRLDCTNIITPLLSIITNISFDHTQFLGHTLPDIAREKAGIIKPDVPVVIGEGGTPDVRQVFVDKAHQVGAPITFAEEATMPPIHVEPELRGLCQQKNTRTILTAVQALYSRGLLLAQAQGSECSSRQAPTVAVSDRWLRAIQEGFAHVCSLTGLMGRWQLLQEQPTVICDTGHNVGGLQYIATQLTDMLQQRLSESGAPRCTLRMVMGMVSDKDVRTSLSLMPRQALYYFTQASVKRAMPAAEFMHVGQSMGLIPAHEAECYPTVADAYQKALSEAEPNDIVFVGGSSFVVADLLTHLKDEG